MPKAVQATVSSNETLKFLWESKQIQKAYECITNEHERLGKTFPQINILWN
jgi:hypothetical protein